MAHRSAGELEEERLMIEAAQRDRAAFAPLYERYVDQIFAYAHTLTRHRELAEDVERAPRQGGGKRVGGEVGAQESSADRIKSDASVTLRCTRSRSGRPVAVSSSPAMK